MRDALLVEYNDSGARLGFDAPARVRSLPTERYRLTIYGGEAWGELYDLREDPHETQNLWDDPLHANAKAELMLELAQQLTALMDESPKAQRLA